MTSKSALSTSVVPRTCKYKTQKPRTVKMKDTIHDDQWETRAQAHLSPKQVGRLEGVLDEDLEVHGRGNFPLLKVRLRQLILKVRARLRQNDLLTSSIKINGGAASYILSANDFTFSDLDLIFPVSLLNDKAFDLVRDIVLDSLLEFLPDGTSREKIGQATLKEVYIQKMVKVHDSDRWSLFSLNNDYGRCIELKFVDQMRRQFEFSVDSFQITLDPLLDADQTTPMVTAESVYGDFRAALRHLNDRLIDTRRPEEIRGGGLLKYCHLLVRGYRAARPWKCRQLERYMCSRFFIDFPDLASQELKLRSYLNNHFGNEDQPQYEYLLLLYRVVSESTVCLMSHERRQTLEMIDRLAYQLSLSKYYQQSCQGCHTPRQTLLYLPRNATYWIPVV